MTMKIAGTIVDIRNRNLYKGEMQVENGTIVSIRESATAPNQFILPGFIDAHVHIESSMLVPSEFARLAVVHGTVATVSDPHEIGNVLGIEGVRYMIANGKTVPFKFYFGAPSCVPATPFETAGATIDVADVEELLRMPEIKYLAEMMNWPGVLHGDAIVNAKIAAARRYNKVVDGHAPGLRGDQAKQYAAAGITTDHECFTAAEAEDKLRYGMKIIIREGSAARNFDALIGLLPQHADRMMFCSDDKHPDSLEAGHINVLVRRAIHKGMNVFDVLQAACINPIDHYGLDVGKLRMGDPADFIVVKDLTEFRVKQTFISGVLVAEDGASLIRRQPVTAINNFHPKIRTAQDFSIPASGDRMQVIDVEDGQLVTGRSWHVPNVVNGFTEADVSRDVLKIAVVNRYAEASPPVAFVRNIGLTRGAIASSVAHDSHNIVAVGVDGASIAKAVNLIMEARGGISAVAGDDAMVLPLPVAGIMSTEDGYHVAREYQRIDAMAKRMGSKLGAPFMTLSFLALLVIPSLKLSDKGLFDGESFQFTNVFSKK